MLTITPLDGAADGWFTVPEPQRPVAPGASVLYPVGVTVPPTTAAGTYGLQGVAYSADHDPGESSATSKRVSLTVGEPAPRKGVPKWIFLVIAAVVLLVIAVIAFLLTRGGDGPADETRRAAAQHVRAGDLRHGRPRRDGDRRRGRVVRGPRRDRVPVGALPGEPRALHPDPRRHGRRPRRHRRRRRPQPAGRGHGDGGRRRRHRAQRPHQRRPLAVTHDPAPDQRDGPGRPDPDGHDRRVVPARRRSHHAVAVLQLADHRLRADPRRHRHHLRGVHRRRQRGAAGRDHGDAGGRDVCGPHPGDRHRGVPDRVGPRRSSA